MKISSLGLLILLINILCSCGKENSMSSIQLDTEYFLLEIPEAQGVLKQRKKDLQGKGIKYSAKIKSETVEEIEVSYTLNSKVYDDHIKFWQVNDDMYYSLSKYCDELSPYKIVIHTEDDYEDEVWYKREMYFERRDTLKEYGNFVYYQTLFTNQKVLELKLEYRQEEFDSYRSIELFMKNKDIKLSLK